MCGARSPWPLDAAAVSLFLQPVAFFALFLLLSALVLKFLSSFYPFYFNVCTLLEKENLENSQGGCHVKTCTLRLTMPDANACSLFVASLQRFEHNSQGILLTFYKLVSTPPPRRRRTIFYVDDTEIAFGACRLNMI